MTTTPRTPPRSRGRLRLAPAAVVVAVLVAGAAGAWYLFGGSGPAAVSLGSPAATVLPGTEPSSSTTGGGAPAPGAGTAIDGAWVVDPSIGSFSDFSGTFVGYRVNEELAGIGAKTAVGRTPAVTGTMTVAGTTITAVRIEADLTRLESDDDRRDGQLRGQALETREFPTATFELVEPIELGSVPAAGETIEATAVGDLTVHGVTRRVELPLQARLEDGVVTVVGSTGIAFADYGMSAPRSMIVLSVADTATMELQLRFTRAEA